jgi:hypothetical protein
MGIMTDFAIADPADAERVCESSPSEPGFEWFQTKGIDNVQVAVLEAAAAGRPFDPKARLTQSLLDPLALAGMDGPAVFQVPPELVERLATLDAAGRAAVADRWAADPNGIGREGAGYVVEGLAPFCRRAREQGKAVLLAVAL